MIFVDQTKFGVPHGNCLSACIASILGVSIEEIPDSSGGDWFEKINYFLYFRDLYLVIIKNDGNFNPRGYCIASGKSPRGDFLHSVVVKDGTLVHDPHPERSGILGIEDFIVFVKKFDI